MHNVKHEAMTKEDFKKWLYNFDRDGNRRIDRAELREALRKLGMSCTWWRSWRALWKGDLNHNNTIEGDEEIEQIIKYAERHCGIVVV